MKHCFIKKKEISNIWSLWQGSRNISYITIQYFSTCNDSAALQGTFGNAWRHFSCYNSWGWWYWYLVSSVSLVTQLCLICNDPMDCSTPGLPVHYQLPEFTQTHGHWVSDAIQPSHPLSSPSPPALNLSQHQGLFQWVSPSHQLAKVLEFQLQHQSFQWTPRTELP